MLIKYNDNNNNKWKNKNLLAVNEANIVSEEQITIQVCVVPSIFYLQELVL